MGARFEALDEGILLVPSDPRYTQVGFNLISVQVCLDSGAAMQFEKISHSRPFVVGPNLFISLEEKNHEQKKLTT